MPEQGTQKLRRTYDLRVLRENFRAYIHGHISSFVLVSNSISPSCRQSKPHVFQMWSGLSPSMGSPSLSIYTSTTACAGGNHSVFEAHSCLTLGGPTPQGSKPMSIENSLGRLPNADVSAIVHFLDKGSKTRKVIGI